MDRHTSPRMTIEETVALASTFWDQSYYIQHLHPNKDTFMARVRVIRARELRMPVGREHNNAAAKANTG